MFAPRERIAYRKDNIWDRSQVSTCSGVLRTVNEFIMGHRILDEVSQKKRNLGVGFYIYRKAYDIVRHDLMLPVYRLMEVTQKNVECAKPTNRGMENYVRDHMQRRNENPQIDKHLKRIFTRPQLFTDGFCLEKVPIETMLEETDGNKIGQPGERDLNKTHGLLL